MLWVRKKNEISGIADQLQYFLNSITALLNIFQWSVSQYCVISSLVCNNSRSDIAAVKFQQKLEVQVTTLLNSNEALAAKVRDLEDAFNVKASIPSEDKHGASAPVASQGTPHTSAVRLQDDLDNSRVYRRVRRAHSLTSFATSRLGSVAWSVFTGLSLAEISAISAIALPLFRADIGNAEHYRFENATAPGVETWNLCPVNTELDVPLVPLRSCLTDCKDSEIQSFGRLLRYGSFRVHVKYFYNPISQEERLVIEINVSTMLVGADNTSTGGRVFI